MHITFDFSVLKEGKTKDIIEKLVPHHILIHNSLIQYVEFLSRKGIYLGEIALNELQEISQFCLEKDMPVETSGERIRPSQMPYIKKEDINQNIIDMAYESDSTLITYDEVVKKIASIKGVKVLSPKIKKSKKLALERFFDNKTMSVHLREDNYPVAKKGSPGDWEFEKIENKKLKKEEIKSIASEIVEDADAIVEIERPGSTIVQKGNYRIVITRPPFSDGWEITAVRPVKLLQLNEYKISDKLMDRLKEQAEGILIAGSPGQGKTTFARALALFYADNDRIVKTIEAPRDLILPETITQFAISHGTPEEIHDILLLSRPDYTIFDEMRNTDDFMLFSDLRLSGVGMIGIVHATTPVDAIQRFIGRIELGVIPQIIDTVVFIKNGEPDTIYEIKMTVKVPSGMVEADLARPVVVVNDFDTGNLEFEIYSYGEETVVVPVEQTEVLGENSAAHRLASETLEKKFRKYSDNAKVEVVSANRCKVFIPEEEIGSIIGKSGKRIAKIEKELGIKIDVEPLKKSYKEIEFGIHMTKRYIIIDPKNDLSGKEIEIYVNGDFLMSVHVGKKNNIRISKKSEQGKDLMVALKSKKDLELRK